jgi:hypothetical protein
MLFAGAAGGAFLYSDAAWPFWRSLRACSAVDLLYRVSRPDTSGAYFCWRWVA